MIINLPKLIGHRGVKDLVPENTIPSIKKAINCNFTWIEVDVKISKDNIPFLLHDNKLDRTTSGIGFPYDYNYSEIENLDAGTWFDKKYSYTYPPSLEEVLKICSDQNIGLNIELKPNKYKEEENVIAVSSLLNEKSFSCPYFFSSFDYKSISLMRQKIPNSYISYLVDKIEDNNKFINILRDCLKINCFAIGFNLILINQEIVDFCKENDLIITVYSNNNIVYSQALELWNLGVDCVFVDNPNSYKKMLKSNN